MDYFTDTDQEAIVQQVITALGTPVFGSVDDNNTITLSGPLADGTYALCYEDAQGQTTQIGKLYVGNLTNLADPTSADWIYGQRFNSSLAMTTISGQQTTITNYIPCVAGDVLRIKGLNIKISTDNAGGTMNTRSIFYDADKNILVGLVPNSNAAAVNTGTLWTYTVGDGLADIDVSQIRYIRFCGTLYGGYAKEDVMITVNQEFV